MGAHDAPEYAIGHTKASATIGRPANSCAPVTAPISANGLERTKTKRKNFTGKRLCGAIVFKVDLRTVQVVSGVAHFEPDSIGG